MGIGIEPAAHTALHVTGSFVVGVQLATVGEDCVDERESMSMQGGRDKWSEREGSAPFDAIELY